MKFTLSKFTLIFIQRRGGLATLLRKLSDRNRPWKERRSSYVYFFFSLSLYLFHLSSFLLFLVGFLQFFFHTILFRYTIFLFFFFFFLTQASTRGTTSYLTQALLLLFHFLDVNPSFVFAAFSSNFFHRLRSKTFGLRGMKRRYPDRLSERDNSLKNFIRRIWLW